MTIKNQVYIDNYKHDYIYIVYTFWKKYSYTDALPKDSTLFEYFFVKKSLLKCMVTGYYSEYQ